MGVMGRRRKARLKAEKAVLKLQREFRAMAIAMSREILENLSFVEDLMQEMWLAVLRCGGTHTLGFFKTRARCRARNFVAAERRRQHGCLDDLKREPMYESRNFLYVPRQVERFREMEEAKRTRLERLEDYAKGERMRRASA